MLNASLMKLGLFMLLIVIIVLGLFFYFKRQYYKHDVLNQITEYENKIITPLLSETQEIVRNIDISGWNRFNSNFLDIQFLYPDDARISVEEISAKDFSERGILRDMGLTLNGGGINVEFYNENEERLGFIRVMDLSPYSQYIAMNAKRFSKEDEADVHKVRNIWKVDRRKNHDDNESVGYVKNGNFTFPWTVIDAGHKNIFSMSDIMWYDEKDDRFVMVEVRILGSDDSAQNMLYGFLKTLQFN